MALLSPQANLFESLVQKIKTDVPEIRFIEQDMGQLENYEMRPAVAWPCALIDIEEWKYSDAQNELSQIGEGIVSIRLGLVKYTDTNSLTTANMREKALHYYELENTFVKALHGWNPASFGKLLRRAAGTERRDDDIRVRVIKFAISYTDDIGKKTKITIPRPDAFLNSSLEKDT